MARKSKRRKSGAKTEEALSEKKGTGKLLEEIVQESLNPDSNLILLEGKIRELEDSGKNYMPSLMKNIRQGTASEQKVVLDLLARKKTRDSIKNLIQIARDEVVSIKLRRQAATQLTKWGENVDQNLLNHIDTAEEVVFAIERNAQLGDAGEEEIEPSFAGKFTQLPKNLKVSIIKQILDEYPQGFSLIVKLVQSEDDLDEKIIDMLAVGGTFEVRDLFTRVLVETKDKNLRRLLKKHLFQMKNKGLKVVIPEIDNEDFPKYLKREPSQAHGYITGIDYLGERLVFLSKSVLGWGVLFFQITLSDQEGLKHFNAFDLNRKEIKDFLNRISKDGVIQLIDVKPDYCYYLIDEAYQINLKKGTTPPEQFGHWKTELKDLKGEITEPIIYSCMSKEKINETDVNSLRERYQALLELDEFKEWLLEPRLMWKYIEKHQEAETSPLVLNPYQIEDRKKSVLREAAIEIFSNDFRRMFKRRLEETAYFLWRKGEEEATLISLAAAIDLGPGGIRSEDHGLVQGLVEKSILLYAEGEDRWKQDGSIVLPR